MNYIELTNEQKGTVLDHYATMDLVSLTRLVFKNPDLDGRSIEAKSIKAFLTGMGKTIQVREAPPGPLELDKDQQAKIDHLSAEIVAGNINTLELAKLIFPNDPTVKVLSKQWRAVHAYVKQYYPAGVDVSEDPVDDKVYEPPSTIIKLIAVVNEYVMTGDHTTKAYELSKLKTSERRQLSALVSYLRMHGLKAQASRYERRADRELFLSTFIRWTHDKADLTQIEQDQMVMAAAEKVNITQIERQLHRIDKLHEEIFAGNEVDENGKKRKLTMSDVELINAFRTKFDAAKSKLTTLMDKLEESRSKRIQDRNSKAATFIDLVNQWQSDEEFRQRMIVLGKQEKAEDVAEVNKLADLGDLEALISGQTKEEGGIG